MSETSPWILNAKTETFETDVIQRSMNTAVVVDFWAPWCEPCRQLAPLLDKLVNEYRGRFVLVKVNVDECPEIASAFGVQSIPIVVGMVQGRPVNQFNGVLPEDQLRKWLETFIPSPADDLLKEALTLEETDPEAACLKLREALQLTPDRDDIRIVLARVLLRLDQETECREIIEALEARGFLEPDAEVIKGQLEILAVAEESGGVQAARAAVEAHPDDLNLQLTLADSLAADRKFDDACLLCLDLIARDKSGIGNDAKETMVRILSMMGAKSEKAGQYRRKLTTAFY